MVTAAELHTSGWSVPRELLEGVSDYERDFIRLECTGQRTLEYYRARLRYLGFYGMSRVLDAGCGIGQWSVAMSFCNGEVVGTDLNVGRLGVASRLGQAMGRTNVSFQRGPLEALPYSAAAFDGVWCYGVFMFTHMPQALTEFRRVLRPGGKLYLNANSYGWYIHLLCDVPWNRRPALHVIKNTLLGRSQAIIVGERWLRARMREHGFEVLAVDCEGDTSFEPLPTGTKPEPGYQRRYWGVRAIVEAVALRRA